MTSLTSVYVQALRKRSLSVVSNQPRCWGVAPGSRMSLSSQREAGLIPPTFVASLSTYVTKRSPHVTKWSPIITTQIVLRFRCTQNNKHPSYNNGSAHAHQSRFRSRKLLTIQLLYCLSFTHSEMDTHRSSTAQLSASDQRYINL